MWKFVINVAESLLYQTIFLFVILIVH